MAHPHLWLIYTSHPHRVTHTAHPYHKPPIPLTHTISPIPYHPHDFTHTISPHRFTHISQAQVDGQAQSLLTLCSFADALQAKREVRGRERE